MNNCSSALELSKFLPDLNRVLLWPGCPRVPLEHGGRVWNIKSYYSLQLLSNDFMDWVSAGHDSLSWEWGIVGNVFSKSCNPPSHDAETLILGWKHLSVYDHFIWTSKKPIYINQIRFRYFSFVSLPRHRGRGGGWGWKRRGRGEWRHPPVSHRSPARPPTRVRGGHGGHPVKRHRAGSPVVCCVWGWRLKQEKTGSLLMLWSSELLLRGRWLLLVICELSRERTWDWS